MLFDMYYNNLDNITFDRCYNTGSKFKSNLLSVLCYISFGQHNPIYIGITLFITF